MTKKSKNTQLYKQIASHSFVAAFFASPYVGFVMGDMYKIMTDDRSEVVYNQSVIAAMTFISSVAFIVFAVSFVAYRLNRKK